MSTQKYLSNMKTFQKNLLSFIDATDKSTDYYNALLQFLKDENIINNPLELKSILYIISNITNNYHHQFNYFTKIKHLINKIRSEITKNFSNITIFNIFKSNKKLLLFLIQEHIITIDKIIASKILEYSNDTNMYSAFFYPEIKPFIKKEDIDKIKRTLPINFNQNFESKRTIGKNDDKIYKIIRHDLVDDFKGLNENKTIKNFWDKINPSIFETNTFLINQRYTKIIDYVAFYGSIKIFNYMVSENVTLQSTIWPYAIHGANTEIIDILLTKNIEIENFSECLNESINCCNDNITKHIINKYYLNDEEKKFIAAKFSLISYNFSYFRTDLIDRDAIYELCRYDYGYLVNAILHMPGVNLNKKEISFFCLNNVTIYLFE